MRFFIGVFISDMSDHFASGGEFRHTEFAPAILINVEIGLLGIAPTRNGTHFLKIGRRVFIPNCINQGNKSDKERKVVRKKLSFLKIKI